MGVDASKERRKIISDYFKDPERYGTGKMPEFLKTALEKVAGFYKTGWEDLVRLVTGAKDKNLETAIGNAVRLIAEGERVKAGNLPPLNDPETNDPPKVPVVSIGKSTKDPRAKGSAQGDKASPTNPLSPTFSTEALKNPDTDIVLPAEPASSFATSEVAGEEKSFATSPDYLSYQDRPEFDTKVGDLQAKLVAATGDTAVPTVKEKLGDGGIDGYYGEKTRKLVMDWQKENDFAPTGNITAEQYTVLSKQSKAKAYFEDEAFTGVEWMVNR